MGNEGERIFISAGDHSGDSHAAHLMETISKRDPSISFIGFGMKKMMDAGLQRLDTKQPAQQNAMWLYNLLSLNSFQKKLSLSKKLFRSSPPKLLILVDYGGFNLFLAKEAKKHDIPVLYYILPQAWAHGRYRLKKISKWVDKAAAIYPFEPQICEKYSVDAFYVGHPVFDTLKSHPPDISRVKKFTKEHDEKIIALFPGSRTQELNANFPIMLKAANMLQKKYPNLSFISLTPPSVRAHAGKIIKNFDVNVEFPNLSSFELARAADLCITKSGTITLEIASQHTPMVILYRLNWFLYFLISGMTHTPYAGIVNSLANKMVCPEKVMWHSEPKWITIKAEGILTDPEICSKMINELKKLTDALCIPGTSEKTADIAMNMM